MKDKFDREITYLRISLTDRCNLRCRYCMPEEGVSKLSHCDVLSLEDIEEIARTAISLGISKIRLTGGEPLVRKGIVDLCKNLKKDAGLKELTLTTNGILLPQYAKDLKAAGLDRVNISLDTLDAEKYKFITRIGSVKDALAGIDAAFSAGLTPVKINTVLIGGFNDMEIPDLVELTRKHSVELRFIELMPIGGAEEFGAGAYIPGSKVLEAVPELKEAGKSGVARIYKVPGYEGSVGLINPVTCSFCSECNRIRLTADGNIKPCLHSEEEICIKGLHGAELKEALAGAILAKPKEHDELSAQSFTNTPRDMNQIGG